MVGRADIVFVDLCQRICANRLKVEKRPVEISRIIVIAENGILALLKGGDQPHAVPVFGDMGK